MSDYTNVKPIDCSDWIASITAINGDLNGSSVALGCYCDKTRDFRYMEDGGGFWLALCFGVK